MTQTREFRPPSSAEYADFYHGYVSEVPAGDIVQILRDQSTEVLDLIASIPPDRVDHRYAAGKWTLKELFGHIVDTERVFSYRALRFARGDTTPLAGLDHILMMRGANFAARDLASLGEEFRHLRAANVILFDSFDEEIMQRTGTASDSPFTTRSMLYVTAGHVAHHLKVVRELYL